MTVVLFAGIFYARSANAQGATATSLADQLKTQYGLAKMSMDSNGTNETQRQAPGGQSSSTGLTNDDIIKLVQAKLPDSIVIAKIKSSSCDFDTTAAGLIKLKQAGISDSVLQAMVEAPPPSEPTGGTQPGTNSASCNDYGSCITAGKTALSSSQWDDAIATFQKASTLDASRPDAWMGMGNAYLGASRNEEASAMWDKVLGLGGLVIFNGCHERGLSGCEEGDVVLGPKEVSLTIANGQRLFSVAPSEVQIERTFNRSKLGNAYFRLKVAGKNYNFDFWPLGVTCETKLLVKCPPEGFAQQSAVVNYVSQTIAKLASGTLGKLSPPAPK